MLKLQFHSDAFVKCILLGKPHTFAKTAYFSNTKFSARKAICFCCYYSIKGKCSRCQNCRQHQNYDLSKAEQRKGIIKQPKLRDFQRYWKSDLTNRFHFILRLLNKLPILSLTAWHLKRSFRWRLFWRNKLTLMKNIIFILNFVNSKRYEKPWHYTAVSNIVETSSKWK